MPRPLIGGLPYGRHAMRPRAARQEHAAATVEDVADSPTRKKGITPAAPLPPAGTDQPRRLAVVAKTSS